MSASFCDCVNQWEQAVGLQVLKDTKYLSLRTRGAHHPRLWWRRQDNDSNVQSSEVGRQCHNVQFITHTILCLSDVCTFVLQFKLSAAFYWSTGTHVSQLSQSQAADSLGRCNSTYDAQTTNIVYNCCYPPMIFHLSLKSKRWLCQCPPPAFTLSAISIFPYFTPQSRHPANYANWVHRGSAAAAAGVEI